MLLLLLLRRVLATPFSFPLSLCVCPSSFCVGKVGGACEKYPLYNTHTPTHSHTPHPPPLPPLSSLVIHTRAALHFLLAAAAAPPLNPPSLGEGGREGRELKIGGGRWIIVCLIEWMGDIYVVIIMMVLSSLSLSLSLSLGDGGTQTRTHTHSSSYVVLLSRFSARLALVSLSLLLLLLLMSLLLLAVGVPHV